MKSTIRFLMATVILLPVAAYFLGTPPNEIQLSILKSTAWIVLGVIAYTFIVGQLTGNNSQVDKLWSIVPIIYAWYMTYLGGWNERMIFMSVLVTIWGSRLTYNFARRGAYTWKFWEGEEDYRWEILRKKPGFKNPIVWMIFNLLFICFYQNVLIFLFTIPILSALASHTNEVGIIDGLLAGLFIRLVVLEFRADQQQYDFQTEKYRRIKAGEDLGKYADGFVSTGLWSKVRHPNYAAEQAIWITFYAMSIVATGEWLNWTIAGCILLVILFKGSADFSEEISASKYPAYKEYQKRVGRFIPKWNRKKQ
jgi:steroid 5-alpha reductase family enzyme